MEIDGLRFRDSERRCKAVALRGRNQRVGGEVAIDFVGRSEEEKWAMPTLTSCFKNVEGAAQVHFEIEPWVGDAGGYGDLRSEVVDLCGKPHRALDLQRVADITYGDLQPAGVSRGPLQSFKVMPHAAAREIVKD